MTITQLSTFLTIAELNSFSAAADSLGYAQSTVTTQIKQLEDELGCVLFDRLGKTISLTSSGERLIIYAEKMLQLEREIRLDVAEEENPAGVLKLGVSESLCILISVRGLSLLKSIKICGNRLIQENVPSAAKSLLAIAVRRGIVQNIAPRQQRLSARRDNRTF